MGRLSGTRAKKPNLGELKKEWEQKTLVLPYAMFACQRDQDMDGRYKSRTRRNFKDARNYSIFVCLRKENRVADEKRKLLESWSQVGSK